MNNLECNTPNIISNNQTAKKCSGKKNSNSKNSEILYNVQENIKTEDEYDMLRKKKVNYSNHSINIQWDNPTL